ncbi:MAG: response regulator [Chitinivibrionales bacterium]|nr:response regulator [Chitinivibrionales bacterium]
MAREQILVVEDEEDILELIMYNLSKEGYRPVGVTNGQEALTKARMSTPDMVILDIMLPDFDGLEICKLLKKDAKTQHIPVIMLTAKGEEADIVTGLEVGADDYMVKPFSPRVLVARLRAILRRKTREPVSEDQTIAIREFLIHPGRHEVALDGKKVNLTFTEFRVLHFLASRPGWAFSRYQIVDAVRGDNYPVTDRSVDVLIVGLRKKLGKYGKYIETVRGVGYRFKED